MNHSCKGRSGPVDQRGVALVVGLVLLLAITILAVSSVMMATSDLRMAASYQRQERAFQAAEAGVEQGMYVAKIASLATTDPADINSPYEYVPPACQDGTTADTQEPAIASGTSGDEYCYRLRFIGDATQTTPPVEGFSLGTAVRAFHFEVEATGQAEDGRSVHTQGFYIIGPSG
jgi:type IV pilus assembly protein PilX